MVWWSDGRTWWLFLPTKTQQICNNLDQCSVNMLSLPSSNLSKSERFQTKHSMVSTACRQTATRNSTLTRFLACSACKNYGAACWGFGARHDQFSCEHCGPIWSGKNDRCMYNLFQMLSATKYCKIGCCPMHSKTRADTKTSTNN